MFKKGDLAVYPAHGVGIIETIETQEVSGCRQDFYIIRILDNNMKIMVPIQNVENGRYREYMDKIKTGSVFEVAEVYRDLLMLKEEKDLSFGERKMLDTARALLVKEISLAKKVAEEQIENDLDRMFSSMPI